MLDFLIRQFKNVTRLLKSFQATPAPSTFLPRFNEIIEQRNALAWAQPVAEELRELFNNTTNIQQELTTHGLHIIDTINRVSNNNNWSTANNRAVNELLVNRPELRSQLTGDTLQQVFNKLAILSDQNSDAINDLLSTPELINILSTRPNALKSFTVFAPAVFNPLMQHPTFAARINTMRFSDITDAVHSPSSDCIQLLELPDIKNTLIQEIESSPYAIINLLRNLASKHNSKAYQHLIALPELQSTLISRSSHLLLMGLEHSGFLPIILSIPDLTANLSDTDKLAIMKKAVTLQIQLYPTPSNPALETLLKHSTFKAFAIEQRHELMQEAISHPVALKALFKIPQIAKSKAERGNLLFIKAVETATQSENSAALSTADYLFTLPEVREKADVQNNLAYRLISGACSKLKSQTSHLNWRSNQTDKNLSILEKLQSSLLAIPAIRDFANRYNAARILQGMDNATPENSKILKRIQPLLLSNAANASQGSASLSPSSSSNRSGDHVTARGKISHRKR